jgi:hypothetical protein
MTDPQTELLRSANAAIREGDLRKACEKVGEVLARKGDNSELLAAYGQLLFATGRLDDAENAASRSAALDPTHSETLKLLGRLWLAGRGRCGSLRLLPGTGYARYALPLDYPPSLRLAPRWGWGRPVHSGLAELFRQRADDYRAVVAEMRNLAPFFRRIRAVYSGENPTEAGWLGAPINAVDLALLYYFVWKHRPTTYLEIGSGSTTSFARRAVVDHGLATHVISIDPQPRSGIDGICDQVIRDGLETLDDLEIFSALSPGDIVFLDGSHRCFMNSDVTVFFLEALPRLKPGVIVHIHDIGLPSDYPESFAHWYWNEQYLLAVHLLGMGGRARTLWPGGYVTVTECLRECLQPPLLPDVGEPGVWLNSGSFWFTHETPMHP